MHFSVGQIKTNKN